MTQNYKQTYKEAYLELYEEKFRKMYNNYLEYVSIKKIKPVSYYTYKNQVYNHLTRK